MIELHGFRMSVQIATVRECRDLNGGVFLLSVMIVYTALNFEDKIVSTLPRHVHSAILNLLSMRN